MQARASIENVGDGSALVRLEGAWTIDGERPALDELERELASTSARRVAFEASAIERWDSLLVAFVRTLERKLAERGVEVDASALPEGMQRLLALSTSG